MAATIFHVPLALLVFIDDGQIWIKAQYGWNGHAALPRVETLCTTTLLYDQLHCVDLTVLTSSPYETLFPFSHGFLFYGGVAIRAAQSHAIGVLCIADVVPRTLSSDNSVVFQHLASLVLDELDLRRAIQQVITVEQQRTRAMEEAVTATALAHTDALTGIANRRAFDRDADRYQLAIATGELHDVLIAVLDVNGLKHVNDTYGHQAGDTLLRTFATALSELVRHEDHVYRFGGDEFAVVMRAGIERADELRARVHDVMMMVRQRSGFTTAGVSIGIASVRESQGEWERALHCADERMYREKHSYRQRTVP